MYLHRFYNLIIVILLVSMGCSEVGNESTTVTDSQSSHNHSQASVVQPPGNLSFQTVDTERYWSWVETDELSKSNVESAGNVDQIDHQIELLEEVSQQLMNEPTSVTDVEKLEYSFLTHTKLSVLHSKKAGLLRDNQEMRENNIERSLDHQEKALSYLDLLIEQDSSYSVDRAFPLLELTSIKCHQNPNRDCLENLLTIVESYSDKDLPYGPYPEWFVSSPVLYSVSYYFNQSENRNLKREMFNELQRISNRKDVIGASASLVMAKHYLTEGQIGTVQAILRNPPVEINTLPEDIKMQWANLEQASEHYKQQHSK